MAKKPSKGSGRPIPKIEINLELSPEQGEELLKTLQVRFEKNMNRHKGLEWPKIQAKLEAHPEKLRHLMRWKAPAVNRMLLVMIKRRANTFFMIVQQKVLNAAEVFATTGKGRKREKRKVFTQPVTPLILQPLWVSSF